MRVLIDDSAFHMETRGGISRHVCLLARLLSELEDGPEVHLFAGWNANAFVRELVPGPKLRVHRLPRPAGLRIKGLAAKLSVLWRRRVAARLCDGAQSLVYHPSFYPLDPWIAARSTACVPTVHDLIQERFDLRGRSALRCREGKAQATRKGTLVLAISRHTQVELGEWMPWTQGRVRVVHNTTDLFDVEASKLDPVRSRGRFFLMVGRRDSYKNGAVALKGFARLAHKDPGLGLVQCGGITTPEEERLCAELGIRDRIHRIHPGDAWLKTHYQAAIGLLYPSKAEGFGLPVLEAMLCGCPVVTTPQTSLPEVGGKAVRYAEAEDPEAWSREMEALLQPACREQHVQRGLKQAEYFRPQRHARSICAVHHEAVALGVSKQTLHPDKGTPASRT